MRLASARLYGNRFSEHLYVASMIIPTGALVMLIILEGLNNYGERSSWDVVQ